MWSRRWWPKINVMSPHAIKATASRSLVCYHCSQAARVSAPLLLGHRPVIGLSGVGDEPLGVDSAALCRVPKFPLPPKQAVVCLADLLTEPNPLILFFFSILMVMNNSRSGTISDTKTSLVTQFVAEVNVAVAYKVALVKATYSFPRRPSPENSQ